jgi:hypothetical protein
VAGSRKRIRYLGHYQKMEIGKSNQRNEFCYSDRQDGRAGAGKTTRKQYNVHIVSRI